MSDPVDLARASLEELTPADTIGELLDRTVEDDGVLTLSFAAKLSGYPGWHWSVSVAELPGEEPTVLEAELLPGDGALLAPDWVPWAERLEEYRAAQAAAAAERGESAEDADDSEDDDLDDDDSDDESDEDEDDLDDERDVDDDIDFENLEAGLAVPASGDDEQDEAEPEPADDGPEHPDEA
jgi:Uncharacterized conserved protein